MPLANADKKVGAVVGMDIPDLNDFVGSFCQACIDNGVQATIVYCNSFSDQEAGYTSAMELYNDGCRRRVAGRRQRRYRCVPRRNGNGPLRLRRGRPIRST